MPIKMEVQNLENRKCGSKYPYTDLDLAVTNRSFLLLKACLPLIPPQNRHMLATYIKFQEFYSTLNMQNQVLNKCCRNKCKADGSLSDLLGIIGDYLEDDQLNSINSFQEMFEMIQLMSELNDLTD